MDHAAWMIPPLLLAAVLAFSAITKLGRGESLRAIILSLRLPVSLLPVPLARAVPGIELVLAAALLAPWASVLAAAGVCATGLMLVYWALIARGMTIHPRPTCGCFGQAGDHRITWRTLVRNTFLVGAAVAATALGFAGHTVWSLLSNGGAGDRLWLALALAACAVTALVLGGGGRPGRHAAGATVPAAAEPPTVVEPSGDDDYVRQPFPDVVLFTTDAGPVSLHELTGVRPQLLIFVDCYCGSTHVVAEQLAAWAKRLSVVDVRMVFATEYVESAFSQPPRTPLLDHTGVAWRAFGLRASPAAVLLGADGYQAGGPVNGLTEVEQFVDDIEAELIEAGMAPRPDAASADSVAGSTQH